MKADREKFTKMIFQALREWSSDWSDSAWIAAGILLLVAILALLAALIWVLRGNLARHFPNWAGNSKRNEIE